MSMAAGVQGSMPGTNVTFLPGHCVEYVGFLVSLSWRLVANWVEW